MNLSKDFKTINHNGCYVRKIQQIPNNINIECSGTTSKATEQIVDLIFSIIH